MKRDYLNKAEFDLFPNTPGALTTIAKFEVAEYSTIATRTDEPFNLFLAYQEDFATVDLSGATIDVTATGDIPDAPQVPDDGGIAIAYVSTDGGSTWTREAITALNYWDAASNPNQITVDTGSYSATDADVRVYYLFLDGQVVLQSSPPKGEYESVERLIGTYSLSRLHRRSQYDDEIAPYFLREEKYPGDWNFLVKLNSNANFETSDLDIVSKIEFPVTFYESGETVPQEQLERELINEMLNR